MESFAASFKDERKVDDEDIVRALVRIARMMPGRASTFAAKLFNKYDLHDPKKAFAVDQIVLNMKCAMEAIDSCRWMDIINDKDNNWLKNILQSEYSIFWIIIISFKCLANEYPEIAEAIWGVGKEKLIRLLQGRSLVKPNFSVQLWKSLIGIATNYPNIMFENPKLGEYNASERLPWIENDKIYCYITSDEDCWKFEYLVHEQIVNKIIDANVNSLDGSDEHTQWTELQEIALRNSNNNDNSNSVDDKFKSLSTQWVTEFLFTNKYKFKSDNNNKNENNNNNNNDEERKQFDDASNNNNNNNSNEINNSCNKELVKINNNDESEEDMDVEFKIGDILCQRLPNYSRKYIEIFKICKNGYWCNNFKMDTFGSDLLSFQNAHDTFFFEFYSNTLMPPNDRKLKKGDMFAYGIKTYKVLQATHDTYYCTQGEFNEKKNVYEMKKVKFLIKEVEGAFKINKIDHQYSLTQTVNKNGQKFQIGAFDPLGYFLSNTFFVKEDEITPVKEKVVDVSDDDGNDEKNNSKNKQKSKPKRKRNEKSDSEYECEEECEDDTDDDDDIIDDTDDDIEQSEYSPPTKKQRTQDGSKRRGRHHKKRDCHHHHKKSDQAPPSPGPAARTRSAKGVKPLKRYQEYVLLFY